MKNMNVDDRAIVDDANEDSNERPRKLRRVKNEKSSSETGENDSLKNFPTVEDKKKYDETDEKMDDNMSLSLSDTAEVKTSDVETIIAPDQKRVSSRDHSKEKNDSRFRSHTRGSIEYESVKEEKGVGSEDEEIRKNYNMCP